jgi:hypothetical protein
MNVEERLKATAPAPPPRLKAAILAAAKRRRPGALVPLAASFLLSAVLLSWILPWRSAALPGAAQDVERLGDPDLETRERAARDLLELGPAARDALREALKHDNPEIRARAAELLKDVALLPVSRELRGALNDFLARAPARAAKGVEALAAADRTSVLKALKILEEEGSPRAGTLRRILTRDVLEGIRYGLLPLESVVAADAPAGALEVWVNESPNHFSPSLNPESDVDYFAEGDEAGELLYRSCGVGRQAVQDLPEFPAKPGGCVVVVWLDLLPFPRRPGRYEILHHSDFRRMKPSGEWMRSKGCQSNTIAITVR